MQPEERHQKLSTVIEDQLDKSQQTSPPADLNTTEKGCSPLVQRELNLTTSELCSPNSSQIATIKFQKYPQYRLTSSSVEKENNYSEMTPIRTPMYMKLAPVDEVYVQ